MASTRKQTEGASCTRPPYFNGEGYGHWRVRIETFLLSYKLDMSTWLVTKNPFVLPEVDPTIGEYKDAD